MLTGNNCQPWTVKNYYLKMERKWRHFQSGKGKGVYYSQNIAKKKYQRTYLKKKSCWTQKEGIGSKKQQWKNKFANDMYQSKSSLIASITMTRSEVIRWPQNLRQQLTCKLWGKEDNLSYCVLQHSHLSERGSILFNVRLC